MTSFCPQCGRSRADEGRFCGTCGHEFTQRAADTGPASAAAPGDPAPPVQPERFRWNPPAASPRWDSPLNDVHPETVIAGWESPPAYVPPAQYPPPAYVPPVARDGAFGPPPDDPGRRPVRRTGIFVVIAVLVVLAAGGGAYALTRSQQPKTPTASQSADAATAVAPGSGAATSPSDAASPIASPSPSPTPSPTNPGTVQVAPGVSDSAEPQVLAYLNHYFSAINAHNYNAYNRLLDAQEQEGDSQAQFDSGYSTTKDSDEVLTGIDDTGGGDVTANVSFTSQQSTGSSVDGSACNDWQISLYLVPRGNSYVMTAAPSGYHAAYSDC